MIYNVKNYTEQGGDKTVIGGTLEIKEGAILSGIPRAANQSNSAAVAVSTLFSTFNALLTNLKNAGFMMSDE